MKDRKTTKDQKRHFDENSVTEPSRLNEFTNDLFETTIETAKELSILNREEALKNESVNNEP